MPKKSIVIRVFQEYLEFYFTFEKKTFHFLPQNMATTFIFKDRLEFFLIKIFLSICHPSHTGYIVNLFTYKILKNILTLYINDFVKKFTNRTFVLIHKSVFSSL